jgi:uncharacterized protein YggE
MRYLFVIYILFAFSGGLWAETARTITVTGEGVVDAVPDMVTITLGVTHQAEEADQAMAQTRAQAARILEQIRQRGVADRDIQTSHVSLSPVWSRRKGDTAEVTGFAARNTMTIHLRDLETFGPTLDAILNEGANYFSGLEFGLQNLQPALNEARRRAVADALAKAALYADAASVRLGPVLSISDQQSGLQPVRTVTAAARSGGEIAPGELSVRAAVTIVMGIAD